MHLAMPLELVVAAQDPRSQENVTICPPIPILVVWEVSVALKVMLKVRSDRTTDTGAATSVVPALATLKVWVAGGAGE